MANTSQRSFASGELAPALYARTDVAKYGNGLRVCRNFIVQRTGGANMRPGFDYVAAATYPNRRSRLIKFVFNNSQAYVLEFSHLYIRIYQDGASIGVTLSSPYQEADLQDLKYVQSGDVLTIVHPSYAPRDLSRLSATSWTLTQITFGPSIDPPTNLVATSTPSAVGTPYLWLVTAIDATTGEESLVSNPDLLVLPTGEPSATNPVSLTWDVVGAAVSYNVYRSAGGGGYEAYTLVGSVTTNSFEDTGLTLDVTKSPPIPFTGFSATDDYPSVVGFYQQRKVYANSNNEPEKVWCSQTGNYKNFNTSFPLQEDDAVVFALANAEVTEVEHVLDLGKMVIGSAGGEWLVEGDAAGVLTPFGINPRTGSYNGCNALQPVKVDNSILYVQSLGNKILELKTNIYAGYYVFVGKDVGVYSTHLLDGYTIDDWDYQQIPNYTTWMVRSDGTLLGFTYLADEELSAWTRHDTDGEFENICVIPEGGEHRVYVVVKRTVNGAEVRYIERMRPLILLDINEACFMDSALEYDGRDAGAGGDTITLTGASWAPGDLITATGSSATEFSTSQVGDARFLRNADGDQIVATIQEVISGDVAMVLVDDDVPDDMQAVAITDWDRAVKFIGGLSHLEGHDLSVIGDTNVVASPNNP